MYSLFANDQILIVKEKDDTEPVMRKLIGDCDKWGLEVIIGKIEYLYIGGQQQDLVFLSD